LTDEDRTWHPSNRVQRPSSTRTSSRRQAKKATAVVDGTKSPRTAEPTV